MHRELKIRQSALEIVYVLHSKYEKHTKCRPQNLRGRNRLAVDRTIIKIILNEQDVNVKYASDSPQKSRCDLQ